MTAPSGRRRTWVCNGGCGARIVFYRSPFTGNPRAFDASPVDPRTYMGVDAYPVMGGRAYKLVDLVEVLQPLRECSREDAETEAYDMPWYVTHTCPGTAPAERTQTT